ncbi:MAG: cytochrome c maturation protein CcmE [Bacteroidetes bacterium]|nr:cytochrome c maturation protein CcmE [Bacteroidota bacterium]
MKQGGIIAIIVVAVAVSIIITTLADAGTYKTFSDAKDILNKPINVVGHVNKSKSINYDPAKDPNFMSFYLTDTVGYEMKVVYKDAKPADFDMATKLVLKGHATSDSTFEAKEILTKCPSKYKEGEMAAADK